jgi:hypothetical protein
MASPTNKHTFIDSVVKDPKRPPKSFITSGYVGKSSEAEHVRIYFDDALTSFIDVLEEFVLHQEELPREASPLGRRLIWLDQAGQYLVGDPSTKRTPVRFVPSSQSTERESSEGAHAMTTYFPYCHPTLPPICYPPTLPAICWGPTHAPLLCPPTHVPPCPPVTHTFICPTHTPAHCPPTLPPPCGGGPTHAPIFCPPTHMPPCPTVTHTVTCFPSYICPVTFSSPGCGPGITLPPHCPLPTGAHCPSFGVCPSLAGCPSGPACGPGGFGGGGPVGFPGF